MIQEPFFTRAGGIPKTSKQLSTTKSKAELPRLAVFIYFNVYDNTSGAKTMRKGLSIEQVITPN